MVLILIIGIEVEGVEFVVVDNLLLVFGLLMVVVLFGEVCNVLGWFVMFVVGVDVVVGFLNLSDCCGGVFFVGVFIVGVG